MTTSAGPPGGSWLMPRGGGGARAWEMTNTSSHRCRWHWTLPGVDQLGQPVSLIGHHLDVPADTGAHAELYYQIHAQPRSAWTFEADLRPWTEKF